MKFFFGEFIIAFFGLTSWAILKQLDPSPSRATNQINSPFGFASWAIAPYSKRATGLIVIIIDVQNKSIYKSKKQTTTKYFQYLQDLSTVHNLNLQLQ